MTKTKYTRGVSETGKVFIPLLFAGDINVYSVARAFNEEYGCVSKAWGMSDSIFCRDSVILDYDYTEGADQPETMLRIVTDLARENSDASIIVMGCGDNYIECISSLKDRFPENVIAPYIDVDFMHRLIHKERFYEMCEARGIGYPTTYVHHKEEGLNIQPPFEGPYIVKPSWGIEYWQHPYPTQEKVYKVDTFEEVIRILGDMYGAGYTDSVIIQNFIPGDDSYMRVLTSYSDRNGKVRMMCLGHTLLEEHTPHGKGNHAVILTEKNEELMNSFKALLEDLHFVGWSNFDIKYDMRDGGFKAFEINTRQGRSNYYVTASGANVARYVVEDRLDGKHAPDDDSCWLVDTESLWMNIPQGVAFRFVGAEKYKVRMKQLIAKGKVANPLINPKETSLRRKYFITRNQLGHYYKYQKYLGK